jgi:hypothetical protein
MTRQGLSAASMTRISIQRFTRLPVIASISSGTLRASHRMASIEGSEWRCGIPIFEPALAKDISPLRGETA